MPLVLPHSVFLLIPRTASRWLREACARACEWTYIVNGLRLAEHEPEVPDDCVGKMVYTFARDPDPWLRSRWALGRYCDDLTDRWCEDYDEFRSRVSDDDVREHFKPYTTQANFVGRTETIADDLINALCMSGDLFDEKAIRSLPKIGITSAPEKTHYVTA